MHERQGRDTKKSAKIFLAVCGSVLGCFLVVVLYTGQVATDFGEDARPVRVPLQAEVVDNMFVDVSIDGAPPERIVVGLYSKLVPVTAEHFRSHCLSRGPDSYVGSVFHRIVSNFVIQGGKTPSKDITFADEAAGLALEHNSRYVVQMANRGPDTNGSQFCFMLKPSPHLNGKHVVFGAVMDGFDVVDEIEERAATKEGVPKAEVKIVDCGRL